MNLKEQLVRTLKLMKYKNNAVAFKVKNIPFQNSEKGYFDSNNYRCLQLRQTSQLQRERRKAHIKQLEVRHKATFL